MQHRLNLSVSLFLLFFPISLSLWAGQPLDVDPNSPRVAEFLLPHLDSQMQRTIWNMKDKEGLPGSVVLDTNNEGLRLSFVKNQGRDRYTILQLAPDGRVQETPKGFPFIQSRSLDIQFSADQSQMVMDAYYTYQTTKRLYHVRIYLWFSPAGDLLKMEYIWEYRDSDHPADRFRWLAFEIFSV